MELEKFSTLLGFQGFPLLHYISAFSLIMVYLSQKPSPGWKKQAMISIRSLYFGIPLQISHQSIICRDIDCWLLLHVANGNCPHVLKTGQILKRKVEYLLQYISLSKYERLVEMKILFLDMMKQMGCVFLLTVFFLYTINHPNFQ